MFMYLRTSLDKQKELVYKSTQVRRNIWLSMSYQEIKSNITENVTEFNYLGSNTSEKDVKFLKHGEPLRSLDQYGSQTCLKKSRGTSLKQLSSLFWYIVLPPGPYTITQRLLKCMNGTYTRMLRTVMYISWREHPTKQRIYGNIPAISTTIKQWCLQATITGAKKNW